MPKSSPQQSTKSQQRQLLKSEQKRLLKLVELERQVEAKGFRRVAGVDEAGRGPLAGPVVAAACFLKSPHLFPGINDSKQLSPFRRRALFQDLTTHSALCYGVGIIEPEEIDSINILQATLKAMRSAVLALEIRPDYLLIDGNFAISVEKIAAEAVIKGDQRSQLIAAASIIAKETRDQLMGEYHEQYPEYGFDQHKGYGTQKHRAALEKYGPCPIHRMSFAPVKGN